MKQYATLEDTVYFWFAANDTSGSGGDGASPAADVRLAGAAVDAIPVLSPTPVLLTHVNYPAGCYEVAVAATAGNGFAANNTYAVFCTLAIDAQNPTGFIGGFDLKPVIANAKQLGGTNQTGRDIGASVLLSSGSGAGQLDFTSGVVKSNLAQILGTVLTETAGYIAAGFKKLFNIQTPVLTMESVNQGADNNTILAHADYGNAKLARTGADGDTLETLSDQVDGCNIVTPPTVGAIRTEIEGVGTKLTAVKDKTDNLPANPAPASEYDTPMGYIPADLADVPIATEGVRLSAQGKLDVNAECDTALSDYGANIITPPTVDEIADQVWDEILTGATHNIATSAGRRLREVGAFAVHSGTAQAGTSSSITLAVTADANNGVYNRNLLVLVGGAGVGQTRTIVDYNGTTKVIVVDRDWRISPNNTTEYQIVPDDTPLTVDHGQVQAATVSTIKIREYASDDDDAYLCNIVAIIAGTGRGQARLVGSYDGTSKVVTLCGDNWVAVPDTTSIYVMIPYGVSCSSCFDSHALGQIKSECDDALTGYDPPTRTEATADKDEVIAEVDANEAKIDALNNITVADIIAGISDGSYDLQKMMRIMFSALGGKSSGGGTPTLTFRDSGDGKNRITATVDANGNRTTIVLDGS
ncbi:hypothetical protein KAU11_00190 [Candidatus Babeliales bacterium]|nr:hypothetical protein [Candidatus Babeliales bacterium]